MCHHDKRFLYLRSPYTPRPLYPYPLYLVILIDVKSLILKIFLIILFISITGLTTFLYLENKKAALAISDLNSKNNTKINDLKNIEATKDAEIKQKDAYILFLEKENADVNKMLAEEKDKGVKFEEQVSIIGKTIEEIQKIQNTDAELLKKYSKVYFLNENYKPASLLAIQNDYLANKKSTIEVFSKVLPYLDRMIEASNEDASSSPIRIISGFRSFEEQMALKSAYKVTYGSGANKFSADQGYSEHQLGTTVDITTEKLGLKYTSFGDSSTYKWMQNNAYKYGFILSYPKGNTNYIYEPWHWRFVGVELATELHDRGIYFYNMDQREIDKYIGKLFD